MLLVFSFCFPILSLVSASEDQREIKVNPGQDVSLQCQGLRDASVTLLEWTRPDLKSDGYVFFYRNERPYENYQHESFHGRVELRDPELKDGDASVVLKNVTFNDTGTYECRIVTNARQEIKHLIDLKVTDSDHTAGNKEGGNKEGGNKDGFRSIVVGLSVLCLLLVVVVGVVFVFVFVCRKRKHSSEHCSYKPPPEKSGDLNSY
ncbi:coxsackievirus and adenovirus receptor homolog isoform X2 [Micropterus dolomieu]|uniref:coxsackievirus and adenovirus receptor homolog isoform X2 n=1 Tax=Micropterus dolomieu TaxID=147949 RepID=UPI001E8CF675|nr:coxsackievirus and adenovirus receptor homolog isoform X2 [Micropterus dolomieu]